MDEDTMFEINKGMPHCSFTHNSKLICEKCKGEYDYSKMMPSPVWLLSGVAWAFAKEHADCGDEIND